MDQFLLIIFFFFFLLSSKSHCRELRPSEHGLPYQQSLNPTPKSQLHSFFSGTGEKTVPEGRNITWWNNNSGGEISRDSNRKDHVRQVLLISSLICGATGVVLLLASAIVYVVRHRKQRQTQTSLSTVGSTSVPNVLNKMTRSTQADMS
ncbi:uncharacterized protein LOC124888593 [Capsicum annuum]|uniref:uncharacterized protein LOC124888593 n=1 Tax=Capsicum annuum TaxID=4072 RepID=UPI001FB1165F|nr:uncharacterized protein LOC124888593 [Capsicum annuum]